ncbi:uncharacterized protein PHALS_14132 [Plasmopara halstedii]|uniref:Uncharacterized protein n=1 Tax=Plasmopara halstedii TaxID=4781 RepID=A0A0N7L6B9_PLAHL|nr:uncharacterized protein PHALS_14132 [Plasmopara halstedii]CEG43843.1 hypothetical protein PHALS_14132 [Plasmopara halstedii]|eukprot:XP_024580212.1 hypothetical protein PHALS_14132 [Plasmopara halstedii]
MDVDSDDAEYALLPPATHQHDTITRQLQREIMGNTSADTLSNDLPDASQEEEEHITQDDEPSLTLLQNPTLSDDYFPDNSISVEKRIEVNAPDERLSDEKDRTDGQNESGTAKIRENLDTSEMYHTAQGKEHSDRICLDNLQSTGRSTDVVEENLSDSSRTSPASKRTKSTTKTTSPIKLEEIYRKSMSLGSTIDSLTDSMFAPNLLEQDLETRSSVELTDTTVASTVLQKKTSRQRCLMLNLNGDSGDAYITEVNEVSLTPLKEAISRHVSTPSKEDECSPPPYHEHAKSGIYSSLSEQSEREKMTPPTEEATKKPTKPKEILRPQDPVGKLARRNSTSPSPRLDTRASPVQDTEAGNSLYPSRETTSNESSTESQSLAGERAISRRTSTIAMELRTRRSSSSEKSKGEILTSFTKRESERRTTFDTSDVLMALETKSQLQSERRQTIDNGLFALSSASSSLSSGVKNSNEKKPRYSLRKRAYDSTVRERNSKKRDRAGRSPRHQSMESTTPNSSMHEEVSANEQMVIETEKQTFFPEIPPIRFPNPSLFSPPPGEPRNRTPLKGILSARKDQRTGRSAVQTTPNKSVNFGPSQGAEFNHGSPSTSMTPMPAKDASRLYPLERMSSDEESDDAETSLNSSILDEADLLDDDKPNNVSVHKVVHLKKSGFDLLQSRRSSLLAPKSKGTSQRRQSLRGYSPLDSRAEFRRRRRQTINITRQASMDAKTSISRAGSDNTVLNAQFSSPTKNNPFLCAMDLPPTSRTYAESSTSSDAGEDMEITGEYYSASARDKEMADGFKPVLSASVTHDEDTSEYSLGHLLAESSVYELTRSAPDPDLHDLPGTLGDLANEVSDTASTQPNLVPQSDARDSGLDRIAEENETMTSSRNQSTMSLASEESDDDYATGRTSLQVNLKSQFDQVSEPSHSPRLHASPTSLSAHLITMEELLSSITLEEEATTVEEGEAFFGDEGESLDKVSIDVKLACAHDMCSEVVQRHAQDVSSWSSAVAIELSSFLGVKAPACFCPENLDDAGREAIQELFASEALVARTGWCQLQVQMERQLTNSLSVGADALAKDVKSLEDSVATDVHKRQNELASIKEMIDREEQMALLLDAVEEQQGAHDEYVKAVKDLEHECSSLLLEDSVLQSRLKVLEGRAAELEPVTRVATTLLGQNVLATEEMLAIQESMTVWKIREATAGTLRLSALLKDVLFDVEICVNVNLSLSLTSGASTSIETNEYLKHREGNTYLPYESDVVLVLQRLLLNPHYISQIANEPELGDGNDGRICSKLQVLEIFVCRSFRFLKELRDLSTHFAMRVGFSLLPVSPYTDFQTAVQIPRGRITAENVTKEIDLVSRHEPKYFTRVCRRLHEKFVR